jgi:membrane protein implicated in regulation of membrane protease activity
MSENRSGGPDVPPTDKRLLAVAGVLLAIPVVALLWVSSYARETPRLWGFPFFFWYQFMWVFICAALTYTAHRLVLAARKPRAGTAGHQAGGSEENDR